MNSYTSAFILHSISKTESAIEYCFPDLSRFKAHSSMHFCIQGQDEVFKPRANHENASASDPRHNTFTTFVRRTDSDGGRYALSSAFARYMHTYDPLWARPYLAFIGKVFPQKYSQTTVQALICLYILYIIRGYALFQHNYNRVCKFVTRVKCRHLVLVVKLDLIGPRFKGK